MDVKSPEHSAEVAELEDELMQETYSVIWLTLGTQLSSVLLAHPTAPTAEISMRACADAEDGSMSRILAFL